MSTAPFNISSDAMQQIVSKAILEGIDARQRDALIEQAVLFMLTPGKKDSWSTVSAPTPLQTAFDNAVQQTCAKVAREIVEGSDALQQRIRDLVNESVADALAEDLHGDLARQVRASVASVLSEARLPR